MNWSAKQYIHGGFTALALLLALLAAEFYRESARTTETGGLVIHSYEMMGRLNLLFRQVQDVELSIYDYAITGQAGYRDHYYAIRQIKGHNEKESTYDISIADNLEELRELMANNPAQRQLLDQMESSLQEEDRFMARVVELREKQGLQATVEFMSATDDEALMERIGQIMLALQTTEKKLLAERIADDNDADTQNINIIVGAFLITLTAITLAYILIMRSFTRRLNAEENLRAATRWQQAILNGSPYAIIATNEKGIIHTFNPAAERMLGYTATEMIEKETPALLHDPSELAKRTVESSRKMVHSIAGDFETLIAKARSEGMEEYECTLVRKDRGRLPVFSSITVLKDAHGAIIGYLFFAKDITEQKRMERMKSEFVSTVSHELRTPMTSIRGALGLIAGGALGDLPVKIKELVSIAHKNSERLVRIVNDILDVEKIESGKIQLLMQSVDLPALVGQAIEANHEYAEKHHVRFVLEYAPDSAWLMADPDRLMQVMANLLSNAAKFSPEGSEVNIRIDHLESIMRISVRDHGPGIPKEFRGRIFEKFAQADGSATRGHEGTGLGLNISRRLAEAMGGKVGYTTELGKGSIFYIDLPASARDNSAPVETTESEHAKSRVLVLIVEDNKDVATLLRMMLEQAGFAVDIAYTLAQARIKLQSQSYAAMTLDLTLPDGDGIILIREVRSQPAIHDLPIVIVSGKAEKSDGTLSGDAVGLVDWLVKPIEQSQLVRALRRAVSQGNTGLPRILHVEDDLDISLILREMLKEQAEVVTATTLKEAEALLSSQNFALVVLDLSLPDGSGIELLKYMNTLSAKSIPVLILSASEATSDISKQVAGVLVKSRTSETRIVDTILSLIHKASVSREAA